MHPIHAATILPRGTACLDPSSISRAPEEAMREPIFAGGTRRRSQRRLARSGLVRKALDVDAKRLQQPGQVIRTFSQTRRSGLLGVKGVLEKGPC